MPGRIIASARRGFWVMRRRDWLLVAAGIIAGTALILTLLIAQIDAYRARSLAASQAQSQASIVADQRAAQTRRIDSLSLALDEAREQIRAQAATMGRQEQAIDDLATQVQHLGGRPVETSVAPAPAATKPTTRPQASPTTAPTTPKPSSTPTPAPTPAPKPTTRGGVIPYVCDLLAAICR